VSFSILFLCPKSTYVLMACICSTFAGVQLQPSTTGWWLSLEQTYFWKYGIHVTDTT